MLEYERVLEVADCETQAELAEVLGIHQSTISAMLNRSRKVPAQWKLTLLRKFGINPDWIDGVSPNQYMQVVETEPEPRDIRAYTTRELFRELQRRNPALVEPEDSNAENQS